MRPTTLIAQAAAATTAVFLSLIPAQASDKAAKNDILNHHELVGRALIIDRFRHAAIAGQSANVVECIDAATAISKSLEAALKKKSELSPLEQKAKDFTTKEGPTCPVTTNEINMIKFSK